MTELPPPHPKRAFFPAGGCDRIPAMPNTSPADGLDRRRFVADPEVLAALDMRLDDLADPDTRSYVIHHEHPELEDALNDDVDQIDLGFGPFNPRLHLTMHEIVATQLWDGEPAEVWETALRLQGLGYERHEILHMLSRPVSNQVWSALHDDLPYDRARHVAELRSLPESWERERTSLPATARHDDAHKQARRSARAARRRNRRPR
jgi:Domain of unknown function (DUF1841)